MLRFDFFTAAFLAFVLSWSNLPAHSAEADSAAHRRSVQTALNRLHQFVGNQENGRRWKNYLMSSALQAELAKGDDADPQVLADVLEKYSAETPGLEGPRFQAVRDALAAWHSELAPVSPEELPRLAREAVKTVEPVSAEKAARAKQELTAAMAELDRFLVRSGSAVATGWKKYLLWDNLTAQLEREEGPEADAVNAILDKFFANKNGLEMPRFTRVRVALRNYRDLSYAAGEEKFAENAGAALEQLAKHLEAYQSNPASGDDAIEIGRTLGELERTGQAPALVTNIRKQFGHPNLFASASQRFAAIGFEEDIHQIQPVRDNILGTNIVGTARMSGRTTLALLNSSQSAQFRILLSGTAVSNNMGYNGPVTLHTTGFTRINGSKALQMNAAGLSSWPAAATCATGTTIHSISARSGLVENIAWKRAGEQKRQAESIASQHAAGRVQAQMNQRTAGLIAENNERYREKFVKPLTRRGEFPRSLRFSSQSDRAMVRVVQANDSQLAAPAAPPKTETQHDLQIQAHESVVMNYGEALLGGYTLTDERLVELLRDDLKVEVPEEIKITEDKDPWEITFARETPVRATFADGGLKLAIRGSRFKRANQTINEPLEIFASYTIEKTPEGAKFTRQGDVEVTFLERERLGAAQIGFKTFIRRKFEALFKPEFAGEGLVLKDRWAKAGTVPLRELRSEGAWLTLGWDLRSPDRPLAVR